MWRVLKIQIVHWFMEYLNAKRLNTSWTNEIEASCQGHSNIRIWKIHILNKYFIISSSKKSFNVGKRWFTLKCMSQKWTKGLRTGKKTAKGNDLIVKPWLTFKSGSQKRTWNLYFHYENRSLNCFKKCFCDRPGS